MAKEAKNTAQPPKQNKSEFVRQVLREIGADRKTPPEGWRKTVEDRLAASGLKMVPVTIYQIRSQLLKAGGGTKRPYRRNQEAQDQTQQGQGGRGRGRRPQTNRSGNGVSFTVDTILQIKQLADQVGGMRGLIDMAQALDGVVG